MKLQAPVHKPKSIKIFYPHALCNDKTSALRIFLFYYAWLQQIYKYTKIQNTFDLLVKESFKGRFLEFRMYHNFAYLFSKL